jgi:hypothetical protein
LSPPNDIVAASRTDKTCKLNAASLRIFNTYLINKYQNSKNEDNVVLDDRTKKALGKEAVII